MNKCPVCNSDEGCNQTVNGYLRDEPLNAADWRLIHEYYHHHYLPFLHNIVSNARMRNLRNNIVWVSDDKK